MTQVDDLGVGIAEVALGLDVGVRRGGERENLHDDAAVRAAAVQIEQNVGVAGVLDVDDVDRGLLATADRGPHSEPQNFDVTGWSYTTTPARLIVSRRPWKCGNFPWYANVAVTVPALAVCVVASAARRDEVSEMIPAMRTARRMARDPIGA